MLPLSGSGAKRESSKNDVSQKIRRFHRSKVEPLLYFTDLVNNNKSIREIALHFNKGKTTIRYWLKKYNLETNVPHQNFNITEKICTKCKILKPIDEYYFKNKTHTCRQAECKTCFNTRITKQFKDLKSELIISLK